MSCGVRCRLLGHVLVDLWSGVTESMRNTVVNALSGSLQEWYTPKQAAKLFDSVCAGPVLPRHCQPALTRLHTVLIQESKEELKALQEMLVDPDWRRAIVRLADRHRGCPVLSFCLKTITRQGHLDEVFAVSRYAVCVCVALCHATLPYC